MASSLSISKVIMLANAGKEYSAPHQVKILENSIDALWRQFTISAVVVLILFVVILILMGYLIFLYLRLKKLGSLKPRTSTKGIPLAPPTKRPVKIRPDFQWPHQVSDDLKQ